MEQLHTDLQEGAAYVKCTVKEAQLPILGLLMRNGVYQFYTGPAASVSYLQTKQIIEYLWEDVFS